MTIDDEAEKKDAPEPSKTPTGPAAPTGRRFRIIDRTAEHGGGLAYGICGGVQPPKPGDDEGDEK